MLTSLLMATAVAVAPGREFVQFQNVFEFSGWVEFSPAEAVENRIMILPTLAGPLNRHWDPNPWGFNGWDLSNPDDRGVEIAENGDLILKYKLINDITSLPADFRSAVIQSNPGIPNRPYNVQFVQMNNVRVRLLVNDSVYAEHSFDPDVLLASNRIGEFRVPATSPVLWNAVRTGRYRLNLEYTFPWRSYRAVVLRYSNEQLSQARISVFRELVQRSSSSSSTFFFTTWRRRTHSVVERNQISSESSASSRETIDIYYEDPTPEMLGRVDELLGFVTITRDQVVQQHQAALTRALTNGNVQLADLHREYMQALQLDDKPAADRVLKALAALQTGDIATFLASGLAFSEAQASSFSRFYGTKTVQVHTNTDLTYSELMVSSIAKRYLVDVPPQASLDAAIVDARRRLNQRLLGVADPTTQHWQRALLTAARNQDSSLLRYLFSGLPELQNPRVTDGSRNNALHLLLQGPATPLVGDLSLLVEHGVDPAARNRFGRTPVQLARQRGLERAEAILREYENARGDFRFTARFPDWMRIEQIAFSTVEDPTGPLQAWSYVRAPHEQGGQGYYTVPLRLPPGMHSLSIRAQLVFFVSLDEYYAYYLHLLDPSVTTAGMVNDQVRVRTEAVMFAAPFIRKDEAETEEQTIVAHHYGTGTQLMNQDAVSPFTPAPANADTDGTFWRF